MQTFKKHERLSGQKIIDTLFSEGKNFVVSPFRVVWLEYELAGQLACSGTDIGFKKKN